MLFRSEKYIKNYPYRIQKLVEKLASEPNDDSTTETKETFILHPHKNNIIKYKSQIHCCQMCGGRMTCKALFHEKNQYGKGIYSMGKKFRSNPIDDYYDYEEAHDDLCDDVDE